MKFTDIKDKLEVLRVFSLNDIYLIDPHFRRATLYDWEAQGKVRKIRNTWYVLGGLEFDEYDYYIIANRIYSPSYISLELALNHYGVIPEAVLQTTSVTSQKTNTFETPLGRFSYKSIKEELFWGYEVLEGHNIGVRIANMEKAILDTLYFNPQIAEFADFESLRYNKLVLAESLDFNKLNKYREIFDNQRVSKAVNSLIEYINA